MVNSVRSDKAKQAVDPVVFWLLVLQALIGAAAIGLLVWELGWPITAAQAGFSENFTLSLVVLALISEVGLAWREKQTSRFKRNLILGALILLAIGRFGLERPLREWLGTFISPRSGALLALVVIQLTLVVPFGLRMLRLTKARFLQFAQPGTLFVGGFFVAIVLGAVALKTPQATVNGISWIDAFFTSASAICVTGLSVVDTELAFTHQGQVIILLLIQAGGLGIMTLTYFMSLMVGQGITLRDSAKLKEIFSEDNMGAMGKFVSRIVILTLVIEAVGAVLIYQAWLESPPRPGRLVWDSIFHSVSAFCNAGFSTYSAGLAEPVIAMNRFSQVIVMMLIIAGGLGFAVLTELPRLFLRGICRPFHSRLRGSPRFRVLLKATRIRMHTRLVIKTTLALLVGGALLFHLSEGWGFSGDRLWESFFNSVTARTAGFNITAFSGYAFSTVVLLCFLMFVGGSPGGTAGGVKTTTFAVALGELWRLIRGHNSLHFRDRRVPRDIVERCTATVVLSLLWVGLSIFLVSWSAPRLNPVDVMFECFSAFGTVGLSRGITADLGDFGKFVIMTSMFVGRVGLLTLVLTLAGRSVPRRYELPDGRLPLN